MVKQPDIKMVEHPGRRYTGPNRMTDIKIVKQPDIKMIKLSIQLNNLETHLVDLIS